MNRLAVLDGWRGVSILLVLAAHLLPLGPAFLRLNAAAGVAGMVIFFNLSGFLITTLLLQKVTVPDFLARRIFRVIPLLWLYLAVALVVADASPAAWLSHYLCYANLPPQDLVPVTAHLWSICLEVQFYLGAALLAAALGSRGLLLLPVLAVGFTLLRVYYDVWASSITWFRIDEVFAGCILALVYHGSFGPAPVRFLRTVPQLPLLILLGLSCIDLGWLYFLRPYLAAALIGATLLNPGARLTSLLNVRVLAYIAGISYALYVLHPLLAHTWLGSGEDLEKYAKRPLLFLTLFALAHASTYYYEARFIALGKRVGAALRRPVHSQESGA